MKIIELRAENIKKLVAVTIRPQGNLVEITGKNGQGKTSVLDSIWWALEGQKNIQAAPIRKGATTAKIKLDLGELVVTRTFRKGEDGDYTTSIVVENTDGSRYPSPQSVIDKLLGELSFDPLAFTRMKPAEQFETLRVFVPGVDFKKLDEDNKADYFTRTELNRRAKEARSRESGITIPGDTPAAPIDETGIVEKLEAAGRHNAELAAEDAKRKTQQADMVRFKNMIGSLERDIEETRARLDQLVAQLGKDNDTYAALEKRFTDLPPLSEPISTALIRAELEAAKSVNARYEAAQRAKLEKGQHSSAAADLEKKSEELTTRMEARKKQKEDAIAAAKLPIEGIGFGDGAILMNGVPFDQASDAEQLRASIAIAAAMNPKLRVIRVRDGSLLDDDAMKLMSTFADANDMQIWIERVDSSGKVGFVLEDGELKKEAAPNADSH